MEVSTQQSTERTKSSLSRTELVTTLQMLLAMIVTNRFVCIIILSTRLQNLGTDKEVNFLIRISYLFNQLVRNSLIDKVYYGCRLGDTEKIGFRDLDFQDTEKFVRNSMSEVNRNECLDLFNKYVELDRDRY